MRSDLHLPKWIGHAVVAAGVVIVIIALVALATSGSRMLAAAAFALPCGALILALVGTERTGIALLCVGFATAALSKGSLVTPLGPSLTLSDLALAGGLVLLAPRIASGRIRIATTYAVGMILIVITGALASTLMDPAPLASLKTLVGMVWCMAILPVSIAALRPSNRTVAILAWSFIAGHLLSVVDAFATTSVSSRQYGLTAQPNEYAESGLIAIALAMYLLGRTTKRWPLYLVMTLSLSSIYLSGSRGALLALAAVLLAVPIIERTTMARTVYAMALALGAVLLPFASQRASDNSAFGRLLGSGGASGSDSARTEGLNYGITQFLHHPISGSGLSNVVAIHINVLEIAVGLGIVGLLGFLLVVGSLLRPLFGHSEHRRLGYTAVAFVVFSATAPALTDRSMWLALSLGFIYFRGYANELRPGENTGRASSPPAAKEHELVVQSDHVAQFG